MSQSHPQISEQPQISRQKSKLEELEESLSSIINEMSFSSHSEAIIEPNVSTQADALNPPQHLTVTVEKQNSTLNVATPHQSVFEDEASFMRLSPNQSLSNVVSMDGADNLDQLLTDTGFFSYIGDFQQTGIHTVSELIRFATQYLPPSLAITPAPGDHASYTYPTPRESNKLQVKYSSITATDRDDDKQDEKDATPSQQVLPAFPQQSRASINRATADQSKTEQPAANTANTNTKQNVDSSNDNKRRKRHKLCLYEVEELLGDEEYCEYALLIRDGGNPAINGYYTCSGKKNEHYMFNHMNDNKAALYAAKNGTWMIVYDDELLYGNPLKYDSIGGRDILCLAELNLYPPPCRCWYSIEGTNPPPGVMWIAITDDPMAFIDEEQAHRLREDNMKQLYMNQLKVDLPVQLIDFMFCGPIGFALRIDQESKIMDVIRIKPDGQAKELGLMHGDTLLKINEEDVSNQPDIAFPLLKECVQSQIAFEVTFLRRKYDELIINVQRAGSPECNGKYIFLLLDEFDAPIFVKENDQETWRICRLDHDDQEGHSIWGIQNIQQSSEYYIGMSENYAPPNNTWETIEGVGTNPAPGLQFISIDVNVLKKLVPDDGPKIRQNIFTNTKRKHKGKHYDADKDNNVVDERYEFGDAENDDDDDDAGNQSAGLDAFKLQIFNQQQQKLQEENNDDNRSRSASNASLHNFNHVAFNSFNVTNSPLPVRKGSGAMPMFMRSDSIMSTTSVYAVPDEVQTALVDYQKKLQNLEKELKAERKRALTLTHQHKTQATILKEHEEQLNKTKQVHVRQVEFFHEELETVNQAFFQLWIKQCDTRLDQQKLSRESYKTGAKFAQTKKQLFQAKRKIDDLEEEVEILRKQLDEEKLKTKTGVKSEKNDFFNLEEIGNNLETIEFQTEITALKTEIARKDIEMEELQADNTKWQEAHDSIFERMTEAQTRLAREIEEFEDAKKFYESKLSLLRDRIQDHSIQFWEYEKRITQINQLYETDANGKKLPEWANKPKIKFDDDGNIEIKMQQKRRSDGHRISITLATGSNKRDSIGSNASAGGGWARLSPMASNQDKATSAFTNFAHLKMDSTLYDDAETADVNQAFGSFVMDPEEDIDSDGEEDVNGAFGDGGNAEDSEPEENSKNVQEKSENAENFDVECEDDEDGATAFGAFGDD